MKKHFIILAKSQYPFPSLKMSNSEQHCPQSLNTTFTEQPYMEISFSIAISKSIMNQSQGLHIKQKIVILTMLINLRILIILELRGRIMVVHTARQTRGYYSLHAQAYRNNCISSFKFANIYCEYSHSPIYTLLSRKAFHCKKHQSSYCVCEKPECERSYSFPRFCFLSCTWQSVRC